MTIAGDLDAHSAPSVDDEVGRLLADGVTDLVLDLSSTDFLDSFGLRALLASEQRVVALGGRLAIRAPSKPVRRLLDIAGLTDFFVLEG